VILCSVQDQRQTEITYALTLIPGSEFKLYSHQKGLELVVEERGISLCGFAKVSISELILRRVHSR